MSAKGWHSNGSGWIKLLRGADPELMGYLLRRPNTFALLTLIAVRARRGTCIDLHSGNPLDPGEAMIGDFESCGLTRQQYRTALTQLISTNQITTRTTNRGTIAKLVSSSIYDINADGSNQQGHQPRHQRATTEQPLTRSKEDKNDQKKEKGSNACPEVTMSPSEPAVVQIILSTGKHHGVTLVDVDKFQAAYPGVSVIAELRKLAMWCEANPKKRKTAAGINRCIVSWLGRANPAKVETEPAKEFKPYTGPAWVDEMVARKRAGEFDA